MSHLVVADLFTRFDVSRVLLLRAQGLSCHEIAKKLHCDRVELIRLIRVINDLTRGPTS
jgi:transcriptional regulator